MSAEVLSEFLLVSSAPWAMVRIGVVMNFEVQLAIVTVYSHANHLRTPFASDNLSVGKMLV
jgi:hypothetical protein